MAEDTADRDVALSRSTATAVAGVRAAASQVWTLSVREYRVAYRAGWAVGLAVAFALVAVGTVAFGASGAGPTRPAAVVVTLAELSVYIVPLAALALGYGTVVGAAERGALEPVLALPAPRWQVLLGAFLGRAAVLAGALVTGLGAGAVLLPGGLGWYLVYLLTAVAAALAFLAVGVLVSTLASEKSHALGAALGVWVWFALGHDLAALGAVVAFDLPPTALAALVLANPAALLRVIVLSAVPTGAGGYAAVLAGVPLTPATAAAGLLAWILAPLALGVIALRRR